MKDQDKELTEQEWEEYLTKDGELKAEDFQDKIGPIQEAIENQQQRANMAKRVSYN